MTWNDTRYTKTNILNVGKVLSYVKQYQILLFSAKYIGVNPEAVIKIQYSKCLISACLCMHFFFYFYQKSTLKQVEKGRTIKMVGNRQKATTAIIIKFISKRLLRKTMANFSVLFTQRCDGHYERLYCLYSTWRSRMSLQFGHTIHCWLLSSVILISLKLTTDNSKIKVGHVYYKIQG